MFFAVGFTLQFFTIFIVVQEVFVKQTKAGVIYFKDGREFPGEHSRYVMAHKGVQNVTAGQMWDFVSAISNNELGILRNFKKTRCISRRMRALTRKVGTKFAHMIQDIPGNVLIMPTCLF